MKSAKREYQRQLEDQLTTTNPRDLWNGVRKIADYNFGAKLKLPDDPALPNELNSFIVDLIIIPKSLLYQTFPIGLCLFLVRILGASFRVCVRPLGRIIFLPVYSKCAPGNYAVFSQKFSIGHFGSGPNGFQVFHCDSSAKT